MGDRLDFDCPHCAVRFTREDARDRHVKVQHQVRHVHYLFMPNSVRQFVRKRFRDEFSLWPINPCPCTGLKDAFLGRNICWKPLPGAAEAEIYYNPSMHMTELLMSCPLSSDATRNDRMFEAWRRFAPLYCKVAHFYTASGCNVH